ncbi:MAG: ATP-binding protein [Methanomassiliicoccales archaeon]
MSNGATSVLYVDDEADLARLAKEYLEGMGDFQVTTSTSPEEALDLALGNLVQNAVVHGGTRKIDFRVDSEECLLTVADHGRGIEDHLKERVFEEGFRRGDGPGMGLFLVRGIVERYGGSVWVEDNFPRGAAFRLRFPNFEKD